MTIFYYPDRAARFERYSRSKTLASLFLTHTLPADQRFVAWRESMGVFMSSRLNHYGEIGTFTGEVESYLIDDIVLSRGIASKQKYDRPAAMITRDSLDHYMAQVFLSGGCIMQRRGHSIESVAGHAIGFDLGDVLDSINSEFDVLCAVVPRARLAPLLTHPDSVHGAVPDLSSGAGRLLADYMSSLYLTAPALGPKETQAAARTLLDMLAAAFNGTSLQDVTSSDTGGEAMLLRAQSFIRQNLSAVDLTPALIAQGLGLSRTVLYRIFEPVGGVALYVREQRLRKCMSDILSVRHADRQISEIAHRWGFTDAAHFSKLFRIRFGQSPSDARYSANVSVRRDRTELDPRVGDRRYEEWIAALA